MWQETPKQRIAINSGGIEGHAISHLSVLELACLSRRACECKIFKLPQRNGLVDVLGDRSEPVSISTTEEITQLIIPDID